MPPSSPTPPKPLEKAWQALKGHAQTLAPLHLRQIFAGHRGRFEDFSLSLGDIFVDFSKQRILPETLNYLYDLARCADVEGWRQRMAAGEKINHTENRPALHMALRAPHGADFADIHENLRRMAQFCEGLHTGQRRGATGEAITDIVNLGIGGSDLGPRMAVRALSAFHQPRVRVHFASNMDGADLALLLKSLNPPSTLFIVVSKTFNTLETLTNAHSAKSWLAAGLPAGLPLTSHFVAVSSYPEAVAASGIPAKEIFSMPEGVGGRFSLWSSAGLSIAAAIGFPQFESLLAGANFMDQHFLKTPAPGNIPLTLALIDLWNVNCIGAYSRGVFPYSQSLELFPAYLQQLEMESTGKSVDRAGLPLAQKTCPIIWGSAGTNGQHSFFQLLHQGGQVIPSDFILLKTPDFSLPGHHEELLANGLAQSAALAFGQTAKEAKAQGIPDALLPYRTFPGNQPSTTFLMEGLTPKSLGQLLALYEHKVFCLSVLWNVNAFDQWGVELGKQMARALLPRLSGVFGLQGKNQPDASTCGLISKLQNRGVDKSDA